MVPPAPLGVQPAGTLPQGNGGKGEEASGRLVAAQETLVSRKRRVLGHTSFEKGRAKESFAGVSEGCDVEPGVLTGSMQPSLIKTNGSGQKNCP